MTAPDLALAGEQGVQAQPWLPLERAADIAACGGKAVGLGRMLRAGLPVPAGVVLTVHALDDFLREANLAAPIEALEASLAAADPAALDRVEVRVRTWFDRASLPAGLTDCLRSIARELPGGARLVVRSSAVGEDAAHASCAGLMDSVLGIERHVPLDQALKRVWASRWSARALAYARAGHARLGRMAVIVQAQVEPAFAGVLFTRSPEPGRHEEMLCEYCEGLAQRLVSGEINPARLAIARSGREWRRDGSVGSAIPALAAEAIDALATAALAAERVFACPQDIEWALDADARVWLVQSRAITAAAGNAQRSVVWSNANVNENFPEPITPLLYSIVAPGYSRYFGNLGRAFGLARRRRARMRADLASIVGVHGGRLYYNLTAIHAILRQAPLGERLAAWFDDFTGAKDPSAREREPHRGFVGSLRDVAELGWIAVKTAWQYAFIERRIGRFEARVDAFAARSEPSKLPGLDDLAVRDLLRDFVVIRLDRWTDASLADAAAMVCYGVLKALVGRVAAGNGAEAAHNALLQGLSGLKSAEPIHALWALAEQVRCDPALRALFARAGEAEIAAALADDPACHGFRRAFEHYLERWGFRCSGELMLTVPSFQERPQELIAIIRACALGSDAPPEARLEAQRRARDHATRAIMATARKRPLLAPLPWPSHASLLAPVLRATQAAIALRERARFKQALLYSRLRRIALELGERLARSGRLAAPEHVFFLTAAELDELLSGRAMYPDGVAALVELRRTEHGRFAACTPADVLIAGEGQYPSTAATASDAPLEGLRGASVCGGVASGRAQVLENVAQTGMLERGDILVTRQTDPGWAPAFVTIAALVLERGGMLSHGAILAREYGIPTLVGVDRATERIAHGARIRVDADRGEVHVLAEA